MEKKLLLALLVLPIVVLSLIFLSPANNTAISKVNKVEYKDYVAIYKNGELLAVVPNVITQIGFNFTRGLMLNEMTSQGLKFISLSNVSTACSNTATNIQEFTYGGLSRTQGSVTKYNNNQFTVDVTFTVTGYMNNVQVAGLHWSSTPGSDGNLFACVNFPVVNLVPNDQIRIVWNVTLTEGTA